MKIAITTPTGKIGSKTVELLLNDGHHDLILLARNSDKLRDAIDRGAEVREGDMFDQEFVVESTKNVDTLFWIQPGNPKTDDITRDYHKFGDIGAAAIKANNIQRVVLLSSIGGHLGKGVGPVNGFKYVEEKFRETAPNLRILRPTYFMENFYGTLDGIKQAGKVFLPVSGEAKTSMIATKDIADVAAPILASPFNGTQVVPLHGPRDYSFNEAANIIGKALGHPVTHLQVSAQDALEAMTGMGMSAAMADNLIEMMESIDEGRLGPEFPRSADTTTPTTLEEFAETQLAPAMIA